MSCKKKCPECGNRNTKKNGKRNRKQCYKCLDCGRWWGGIKTKDNKCIKTAYHKYAFGRRTLEDLSKDMGITPRTLKNHFDKECFVTGEIKVPRKPINAVMDATFFTRSDGVLIIRGNGRNMIWKEIETEKAEYYEELITMLINAGVAFASFTIDGKRGVLNMLVRVFSDIPVQYCQFHQIQTVTRYLSKRPKLEAGKELRNLTLALTETDRETFTADLNKWYGRWEGFLSEKTTDPVTGRWHFTHGRLRSAYRSLKTNLPYLFTYLDYPGLNIPNTTNSCDGSFAHWKNRLKVHRGLKSHRKKKMMSYLLENS